MSEGLSLYLALVWLCGLLPAQWFRFAWAECPCEPGDDINGHCVACMNRGLVPGKHWRGWMPYPKEWNR